MVHIWNDNIVEISSYYIMGDPNMSAVRLTGKTGERFQIAIKKDIYLSWANGKVLEGEWKERAVPLR
jgi:hypothetical protein